MKDQMCGLESNKSSILKVFEKLHVRKYWYYLQIRMRKKRAGKRDSCQRRVWSLAPVSLHKFFLV